MGGQSDEIGRGVVMRNRLVSMMDFVLDTFAQGIQSNFHNLTDTGIVFHIPGQDLDLVSDVQTFVGDSVPKGWADTDSNGTIVEVIELAVESGPMPNAIAWDHTIDGLDILRMNPFDTGHGPYEVNAAVGKFWGHGQAV